MRRATWRPPAADARWRRRQRGRDDDGVFVLRGDGFGLVKFRQPNDGEAIIYLDTWVRGLAANTSYVLQRAVDTTIDGDCTSSAWLTLGKGAAAQAIVTE